ncbi:RsmB/NOP family class I SAM-dependent RNA methyltransferase [Paenibacillus odorifer]|jgi:NOL1/NOP2/sun family putative RNA methylase|uniref:RsmB/NOP family class I SAM-dependent RNA methyltransferase n=1 Tax=Paenibacillus TaxID=44249 RepID=UPI00096CC531|nr:RsmB/NOP family class I SAM-dependent RNA methyltransferase [Paenibacillus odorifer]OMC75315.1 rRNA cytosine-C5-methyltransferase [Paenibacillus odorifer]OMD04450.1 rRNA cytosine-C5-methyltransferase [Paenibacillus odorifer]OME22728.1 rRNA cytosine-C5-methyltransferase [Paenibacillus odorifer]OME38277.1 rRNA cytosine-C5-methyltransferase [Paenibacillus odorifer]OME41739.1 rRNA cytosine-C5-methyltransferase [Paenibacillus odorifer]
MAAQLPSSFSERMMDLLGTDYNQFADSYKETPNGGVRVNTLKISVEKLQALSTLELEPIPWCPTGFYTEDGARPGKHPHYHAGLYYIQEPSAMAPVELLDVQPGDRVLDLCAAPGGKSTQISAKLSGEGLLVTNDLHPERTKALAKNLELYGVRNGIVLNESPDHIAAAFPLYFDKILIDAPCSGEGMFRKDEDMVKQWDSGTPAKYAAMQRDILRSAATALAPGGTLVYSTCTFATEENEEIIAEFISEHPQFSVITVGGTGSFAPGFGELSGTARLWPHKVKGEGHFMAVLQHVGPKVSAEERDQAEVKLSAVTRNTNKKGTAHIKSANKPEARRGKEGKFSNKSAAGAERGRQGSGEEQALAAYGDFIKDQLGWEPKGYPIFFGDHLYISPLPKERLNGLKAIRPGWYVGHVRNGRFIPGHPMATALHPEESCRSVSLSSTSNEAISYLKGETLLISQERLSIKIGTTQKGYVLVCIDGYSAGWGKWQDGVLKNEYPAGWRWM